MSNKKRPNCQVSGCSAGAQNTGRRKDGSIIWRKSKGKYICATHHRKAIAKKHGHDSYYKAFPTERLKEALDAGYSTRLEYNDAMYLEKIKEAGFNTKREYRNHLTNERNLVRNYASYEAITKFKCTSYFMNDRKRNLWNSYDSVEEMTDDLIDKVHENMKKNNGKVISEMEGIELSHNRKDIFQISFDRKDNTIGHAKSNIRIVSEPFNTMTKDKFNDGDWYNYREALVEAA